MIPVFSLAGVPPLSGFIGKLALVRATFAAEAWWTGAIILAVGVLTIISMGRLWDHSFWKPSPQQDKLPLSRVMALPIVCLAIVTLAITFAAAPLFAVALRASDQLLNPQLYMNAVLKGGK
jgi:multicomponent Na+:H+ antiporter subunit D